MKVYATESTRGKIVVKVYNSKKSFLSENGNTWLAEKFLSVTTSEDLGRYELPYSMGMIVAGQDQIAAHNAMHGVWLQTRGRI
tara:strand:+ start:556 stop:804 length:249 start_codon:yes stop_codon:yes gene_type:complete